jgi:sugar phosphate permease
VALPLTSVLPSVFVYACAVKFRREQVVPVVALVAVYAAFYLCRANVDASLPLLSRAYGYDKAQLGRLASTAIVAYAVGKLALGSVADRAGGLRMLLIVIGGSVAASFAFGAGSSLLWLTCCAVTNRFFQAGGWCSVVELSSRRFEPARHGTVMGIISSSYEIGNVVSLLFCGALVASGLGWRWLFVFNPILFAVIGVACLVALRQGRVAAVSNDPGPSRPEIERPREPSPEHPSIGQLFTKPAFLTALLLSFLLTFIRTGFLTWMPTFLAEAAGPGNATVAAGIIKSAAFPAAGIVGALAAGRASDAFGPGRRGPVILACLASLSLCVWVLGHAGIHDLRIAVVAIAGSGLFLLGPYSLVGGAIVLDVAASTRPALVSGILDSAGYLGATLSGYLLGATAQTMGWTRAFDILAAAAVGSTVVSASELVVSHARARAARKIA